METHRLLSPPATAGPDRPLVWLAASCCLVFGGWCWLAGTLALPPARTAPPPHCPGSAASYALAHDFFGGDGFFDERQWLFFTAPDPTGGPTQYLSRADALGGGLIEQGEGWAVLRAGPRETRPEFPEHPRRQSVRIHSRRAWQHMLIAVSYSHVPHGCGVWPALWLYCDGAEVAHARDADRCGPWPENGEIDLLEFSNEFFSKTSLHLGAHAQCKLDPVAVRGCGPFLDKNGMHYDCATDYFRGKGSLLSFLDGPKYGCAPNRRDTWPTPQQLNSAPGTFVFEWTPDAMKVWNFVAANVPRDLADGAPKPATWDASKMWSFYPLAGDGCPGKRNLRPLNLVINIAFCGDWAGGDWARAFDDGWAGRGFLYDAAQQLLAESCASRWGGYGASTPRGACDGFILSRDSDAVVARDAYFNLTGLKVFTAVSAA
mmetsp:Transcript_4913/g.14894  ORF Transcript_4913/g.14894 Transcript_4913/m.14894 type:complete len:431 (+) Transcript_4913:310-1602(+)